MKRVILIAGPSGAGKTKIANYLTQNFGLARVITHTTRPRRPKEVDGQDYYFETPASFAKLHFFEQVHYGNYQYGSSHEALQAAWQKSRIVTLIVEIKGVEAYLKKLGQKAYFLYVTTSNKTVLHQRLLERGATPANVRSRLQEANLNHLPRQLKGQAHLLLNDDWSLTQQKLTSLMAQLQA